MGNNIEPDGFAQWAALSNSYDVSLFHVKCRGAMYCNILMPLFKTPVFGNVMEVIPPDDNGVLHLSGSNKTFQDASTDRYIPGERTLLVHIGTLNCCIRGLDSKSDRADVTHRFLALVSDGSLTSYKNGILALISLFVF